jgi:hypothetical protein
LALMTAEAVLADELRKRYPLLLELVVQREGDPTWESFPGFLGFLLAAAETDRSQACCIVLPEAESTGYLTAVVLALSKLRSEFPDLLRDYATRGLEYGERVRVLPTGHVYKYGGLWPGLEDVFQLRVLNAVDRASRTFPVAEILRLEPTERVLPKGKGSTSLGHFELSPLDRLIGIQTGGNCSLFRNHVLYLPGRGEFQELLSSIRFACSPGADSAHGVSANAIPWGQVSPEGKIERDDQYQRSGEPLVAITQSSDYLAEACELAAKLSKYVIVNEIEKLSRNLQAYDRIAASQRLLIVANHRSTDAIALLAERGCRVWPLSPSELFLEEPVLERRRSTGVIGRFFRAADNWRRLDLSVAECSDSRLEVIAASLQTAGRSIRPEQSEEEGAQLLGRLYSLLCRASDACDAPSREEVADVRARIEVCKNTIQQRTVWLPAEVSSALRVACEGLDSLYRNSAAELGHSKGARLMQLLTDLQVDGGTRIGVITRTSAGAVLTRAWLGRRSVAATVLSVREAADSGECDVLVLTSWPNSRQCDDLLARYLAPRLCLVGYEFERAWFRAFKRNRAAGNTRVLLPASERSALTGIPEALLRISEDSVFDPEPAGHRSAWERVSASRIEDILSGWRKGVQTLHAKEETRPAKYVGFVGATFAYLTEWQHVPVVTAVLRGTAAPRQQVPTRTADELSTADYVVFREGGESNIIRSIAEELAGPEQYARLRDLAEQWRTALWRLADNVEVRQADPRRIHRTLNQWGLGVGVQTVRKWLYDETQIGPGQEHAIDAIAKAAKDEGLQAKRTEIWDAIRAIRTLHVDAGFRLTATLLDELRRNPPAVTGRETRLPLGRGEAWVVEVEEIGDAFEERPASQVNRLLWDDRFA